MGKIVGYELRNGKARCCEGSSRRIRMLNRKQVDAFRDLIPYISRNEQESLVKTCLHYMDRTEAALKQADAKYRKLKEVAGLSAEELCKQLNGLEAKLQERTEALAKCRCWSPRVIGTGENVNCGDCPPCLARKGTGGGEKKIAQSGCGREHQHLATREGEWTMR